MVIDKEKAVSFTGYRTSKIPNYDTNGAVRKKISYDLDDVVELLYNEGFRLFLSGMAEGFDMLAAEAVGRAMREHRDIKLVAVVPFRGQEQGFCYEDKERYHDILNNACEKIIISESYHVSAFFKRNDFLLDNCSQLVCYYDGQKGGTKYTFERAKNLSIPIINIVKGDLNRVEQEKNLFNSCF